MKARIELETDTDQNLAVLLRGLADMAEGGLITNVSATAEEGRVEMVIERDG